MPKCVAMRIHRDTVEIDGFVAKSSFDSGPGLTAVRPSELRGARWEELEDLNGKLPLWRIPAWRMKGDLDRKEELNGDHLVPLTPQAIAVRKAL